MQFVTVDLLSVQTLMCDRCRIIGYSVGLHTSQQEALLLLVICDTCIRLLPYTLQTARYRMVLVAAGVWLLEEEHRDCFTCPSLAWSQLQDGCYVFPTKSSLGRSAIRILMHDHAKYSCSIVVLMRLQPIL